MVMEMKVRRAQVDDRAPLLELWERSVRATHIFLVESDLDTLRPLVAEGLASDDLEWWVLLAESGERMGFMGYLDNKVEALFLDPDYLRQGGGRFLIAHAQRLSGGALAVDVNEQNEAALRFYEAEGFVVIGRSPTDELGLPFPILHMKRAAPTTGANALP